MAARSGVAECIAWRFGSAVQPDFPGGFVAVDLAGDEAAWRALSGIADRHAIDRVMSSVGLRPAMLADIALARWTK